MVATPIFPAGLFQMEPILDGLRVDGLRVDGPRV